MPDYTLNDLRAHLKYLRLPGNFKVLEEDQPRIEQMIAWIGSLTREERQCPALVLESKSRWRRATRGAGAAPVGRRTLRRWLALMNEVRDELR
ncbi:MAG: hypothetical protein U0836_13640 [Pirellulales bacterium]